MEVGVSKSGICKVGAYAAAPESSGESTISVVGGSATAVVGAAGTLGILNLGIRTAVGAGACEAEPESSGLETANGVGWKQMVH